MNIFKNKIDTFTFKEYYNNLIEVNFYRYVNHKNITNFSHDIINDIFRKYNHKRIIDVISKKIQTDFMNFPYHNDRVENILQIFIRKRINDKLVDLLKFLNFKLQISRISPDDNIYYVKAGISYFICFDSLGYIFHCNISSSDFIRTRVEYKAIYNRLLYDFEKEIEIYEFMDNYINL